MNIETYADRDLLAIDVADRLASDLGSALMTHDAVTLAVPGGTTPGPVFDALCAADVDWSRVTVLPTDERWVPEDDPRSNAGLIRARLLTGRAAAAQFLSLRGGADTPEAAAAEASERVAALRPVSVLLLGMGKDMHIASLFPGAEGMAAALDPHGPAVAVTRPASAPEVRLTLGAGVLDGALSKHLLILGAEKRAALDRALSLPPEEAPVNAVLSEATVHWAD